MKRFKNILCIITREDGDRQLLERAVRLAESNQARLRVVAVTEKISIGMGMPDGGPISERLQQKLIRESEERLEAAVAAFRHRIQPETGVLVGTLFLEVIREVMRRGHDLVIKAAEDPEWLSRLFGSDDMHLMRKCPCPVWLLKAGEIKRFKNILAAVDLDDAHDPKEIEVRWALNDQVFQLAASLAVSDFAELHVGHAWDIAGARALRGGFLSTLKAPLDLLMEQLRRHRQDNMDQLLQRQRPDIGPEVVELHTHLVKGAPRVAIPDLVRAVNADLVVMGTVARTGIPGFIVGNTAEMILSQIGCSVMAVKPPGFTSPVVIQDSLRF